MQILIYNFILRRVLNIQCLHLSWMIKFTNVYYFRFDKKLIKLTEIELPLKNLHLFMRSITAHIHIHFKHYNNCGITSIPSIYNKWFFERLIRRYAIVYCRSLPDLKNCTHFCQINVCSAVVALKAKSFREYYITFYVVLLTTKI